MSALGMEVWIAAATGFLLGAVVAALLVAQTLGRRSAARVEAAGKVSVRWERLQGAAGRLAAVRDAGMIRQQLMQIAQQLVGARRAAVWVRDGDELTVSQAHGLSLADARAHPLRVGEGLVGGVVASGETLRNGQLTARDRDRDTALSVKTHSSLIVPLVARGRVCAVLDLRNKAQHQPFLEEDQRLVESLSRQVGAFLAQAAFRQEQEDFEESMLSVLVEFIDGHLTWDGHTLAVVQLCSRLATALELPAQQRRTLRLAAMVHDIGLQQFPEPRSGAVGGEPMHAPAGGTLLERTKLWASAAPLVRMHEERMDGTGPLEIPGSETPLGARILALAEYVDTVTNPASPWFLCTTAELKSTLAERSDGRFDRAVVRAWLAAPHTTGPQPGMDTIPLAYDADIREELDLD
ncbi:MAG: GAF domain-containing protein [Deltaproteobacteria bacterium]|nr:GAF domain-containing protein [Deltaproteobacteria bacterium]